MRLRLRHDNISTLRRKTFCFVFVLHSLKRVLQTRSGTEREVHLSLPFISMRAEVLSDYIAGIRALLAYIVIAKYRADRVPSNKLIQIIQIV